MNRVFVYGTLRAGHGNHERLLRTAQCLDPHAVTQPGYRMATAGGFPMVHRLPLGEWGAANVVQGEVYEVDDATLAALDRLEGHPRWYQRTEVILGNGMTAFIYLNEQGRDLPTVEGGDWNVYSAARDAARYGRVGL